jgi:RimJ/RimL family protein N-acetyltransferase
MTDGGSPRVLYRTERLVVRRLDAGDLDAMLAVYSAPEAMRYVGKPLERSGCEKWIDVTLQNYQRFGYGMSAVTRRPAGDVIGFCGLVHPGGQAEAEVKYAFLAEAWGQGLATESVQGMLAYGASEHGLHAIIATAEPDNVASHRVLEKCGMQREAPRREADGALTELFTWRAPGRQQAQPS